MAAALVRDLPPSTLDRLYNVLDASQREQNWKALAMLMNIYDQHDINQFELELLRPQGSPSRYLIQDFATRNYSVDVLFRLLADIGQGSAMELLRRFVSPSLRDLKPNRGVVVPLGSPDPLAVAVSSLGPTNPASLPFSSAPPSYMSTRPTLAPDTCTGGKPVVDVGLPGEASSPIVTISPANNTRLSQSSSLAGDIGDITVFSYQSLSDATGGFSDNMYQGVLEMACGKVGSGGFGTVYKGVLREQMYPVAVKKLGVTDKEAFFPRLGDEGKQKFCSELKSLSKFRHPNLLTLMGCSFDTLQLCLVYEWMKGGSLEDRLSHRHRFAPLNAKQRVKICHDVSKALLYIHTAGEMPLVHCNVKSSNILLGVDCTAKLGDFGLARSLSAAHRSGTFLRTRSSYVCEAEAYLPPEYGRGKISPQLDIFSFGIVMLQMITGQKVIDPRREPPDDLFQYMEPVLESLDEDDDIELTKHLDSHAASWPQKNLLRLAKLAKECLCERRYRPQTNEVAVELEQLFTECQEAGLLKYSGP